MELADHTHRQKPEGAEPPAYPSIFAGRYVVESADAPQAPCIGTWAKDIQTGNVVALRFFPSLLVLNPADLSVAQHVVASTQAVSHPGLVAALEVVRDGRDAAIVSPWIEGPTLREVMADPASRFFRRVELRRWIPTLLDVFEAAHRAGVIHGALNPDAIFLEAGQVKVAGFGVNAWLRRAQFRRGPCPPGDDQVDYLSPAQRRLEAPRMADDIYALGAVLYEMVAGTPPRTSWWKGLPSMSRQRRANGGRGDRVPFSWESAVARCLRTRESSRLGSATELRSRLRVEAGTAAEALPARDTPAVVRAPARKRLPVRVPARPGAVSAPPVGTASSAKSLPVRPEPQDLALLPAAAVPAVALGSLPAASASRETRTLETAAGAPDAAGLPEEEAAVAKRKPDTSAWPPPRPRGIASAPPSGASATFPPRAGPVTVIDRTGLQSEGASGPRDTAFLRAIYILVLLATIGVGGWMAWRFYEDKQGLLSSLMNLRRHWPLGSESDRGREQAAPPPGVDGGDGVSAPAVPAGATLHAPAEEEPLEGRAQHLPAETSGRNDVATPASASREGAPAPPPSPPPVAQGALVVRTQPPGAEVVVGDLPPQSAPFDLPLLAPGTYLVRAHADGYAPYEASVSVHAGETSVLEAPLERLSGRLQVVSEPAGLAFAVRTEGDSRSLEEGTTPAELQLPTGPYVVRFRRYGALQVKAIEVEEDRLAVARATFVSESPRLAAPAPPSPEPETAAASEPALPAPPLASRDDLPVEAAPTVVPPELPTPATEPPAQLSDSPSPLPEAELPQVAAPANATGRGEVDPNTVIGVIPRGGYREPRTPVIEPAAGRPLEGGIFELGGVDVAPQLLEREDPVVPSRSFRSPAGERVELIVVIDRMGRVASAEVRSATDRSLIEPSLRAVRLWRFSPAKKQGHPVPVRVSLPLVFQAR